MATILGALNDQHNEGVEVSLSSREDVVEVIKSASDILESMRVNLSQIKKFAFASLAQTDLSKIDDTWVGYSDDVDLNIHNYEGFISIQAYPVINNSPVTKEHVDIARLNVDELVFDALTHYGHVSMAYMTPKQIAETNVIEHLIAEIEFFKDLDTSKDLETASELCAMYLQAIKKS